MMMLVDASAAFNQGGGIGGSARHIVVRAPAVVYPPWYEGVGLPMLEASAVGVPVVASSAPVPREVAADTAVYADPGDAAALATPVEVALTSDQRPAVARAGRRRRARRYDWATAGAAPAGVLGSVTTDRARRDRASRVGWR